MIYFIQAEHGGPVKIGTAQHVESRRRGIQTGSPWPLVIRHSMPGGAAEEKALHERFRRYRMQGEWFFPADEILAFWDGEAGDGVGKIDSTTVDNAYRAGFDDGHSKGHDEGWESSERRMLECLQMGGVLRRAEVNEATLRRRVDELEVEVNELEPFKMRAHAEAMTRAVATGRAQPTTF